MNRLQLLNLVNILYYKYTLQNINLKIKEQNDTSLNDCNYVDAWLQKKRPKTSRMNVPLHL